MFTLADFADDTDLFCSNLYYAGGMKPLFSANEQTKKTGNFPVFFSIKNLFLFKISFSNS